MSNTFDVSFRNISMERFEWKEPEVKKYIIKQLLCLVFTGIGDFRVDVLQTKW